MNNAPLRSAGRLTLRFLLGVAILVALVKVFKVTEWEKLIDCRWPYLIGALLASIAGNITGTLRWQYCLRAVNPDHGLAFLDLFHVFITGTMLGLAVVGGSLGLAYQALVLKHQGEIRLTKAAESLALDRLLDPLFSAVILALAAFYLAGQITLEQFSTILWLAIGIAITALLVGGRHFNKLLIGAFGLLERLGDIMKTCVSRIRRRSHQVLRDAGADGTAVFEGVRFSLLYLTGLTLLRIVFFVLRLRLIGQAFGFAIPIEIILTGMTFLQLGLLLSLTPGALGIAELGWITVLARYGFTPSDGAFVSLSFRIYLVVFTLLTFLCVWISFRKRLHP